MKRLLIILLLLIASPALAMEPIDFSKPLARMGVVTLGAGVAAAGISFCASCPDADGGGDVLCEMWGSSPLCTWSATTDTGDTADGDNTRTAGIGCTDAGTKSIKFINDNDTGQTFRRFDIGSAVNSTYTLLYYYVSATTGLDNAEAHSVAFWSNLNNGTFAAGIYIKNTSGTFNFTSWYWNGTAGVESTCSTAVTAGNWYPIRMTWITESTYKLEIDFNNDGDFADANEVCVNQTEGVGARTVRYFMIGHNIIGAANAASQYASEYANIKIDDDTMPSLCAR